MANSIVIIDDHPVIVMALEVMLVKEGYNIIAKVDNGVDAIKVIKDKCPNYVILDIGIPKLDGLEVISRVISFNNHPKILVFSGQPSDYIVSHCQQLGASGYVSKDSDISEVVLALKTISSGYNFFPQSDFGYSKLDESGRIKTLSSREVEVLLCLIQGKTNNEIANSMLLSNKTISTYKKRVLDKLNAKNIVDLIDIAKRNNIK